jgi:hypothetical protein
MTRAADNDARTYTHPLAGEVVNGMPRRSSTAASPGGRTVAECVCYGLLVILLLAVFYASLVAFRYSKYQKLYEDLRSSVEAAQSKVEYEPLSHAGDGSYTDSPDARSKRVLSRLRGWRDKH